VNGAAGRHVYDRLQAHFPDAVIVRQEDADRVVEPILVQRGLSRLLAARRASPFMLKLTDYPLMAKGATVLGIDSDILFFCEPRELLERCRRPEQGYLVQRDPESTYNTTTEVIQREFGIQMRPNVNTGLLVYPTELPDLTAFERYLQNADIARPTGLIEQTLYALHGSELQAIDYLPPSYALELQAGVAYDPFVARHYAGLTRPLLTSEGIPWVLRTGVLSSRAAAP